MSDINWAFILLGTVCGYCVASIWKLNKRIEKLENKAKGGKP